MTINGLLAELNEENQDMNYCDLGRICNYGTGYICDIISEIADNDTNIYYSDIMDFISKNPDSLADVVAEGLYDPSHDYDLFKHGQVAQYMEIERELYSNMDTMLKLYAVNYIKNTFDNDMELPEEIENAIKESSELDSLDSLEEIDELIDEVIESLKETEVAC